MDKKVNHTTPKFRTQGTTPRTARVFLQCSSCEKDIREIRPKESVDVRRAYYCPECDPGAIVLKQPDGKVS